MQKATENHATYPAFLLRNPTEATEFQRELMVGISQAEAEGDKTAKEALVRLLKATVEAPHLACNHSGYRNTPRKPSARDRSEENDAGAWHLLSRMWSRSAG